MTDSIHCPMRRSFRRRSCRGLQALAAGFGLFLLLGAGDASSPPPPPPFVSGEMIGTLPGSEWKPVEKDQRPERSRAAFYLEGDPQLVIGIALTHTGAGEVHYEYHPNVGLRATFHGETQIEMHPLAFQDGMLAAGIRFGAESGTAVIGLFHGGALMSTAHQDMPNTLSLPMNAIRDSGALDEGIRVVSAVPMAGRSILRVSETSGSISIVQSY